jgi:putative transposase
MGYVKIWLHFVWTTKNRAPLLTDQIRRHVFDHIRANALTKGIFIEVINGYHEHVHCLCSLGTDQSVDKIIMLMKGESSFWINKNKLTGSKFEWQDSYFAVSVSESGLPGVRDYIKNQAEHHRRKSFQEEYDEFIRRYGFNDLFRAKARDDP